MALYGLAQQLLTPQQHYDWGLRALKTTLGIAGRLLLELRSGSSAPVATELECQLVMRAVRLTTLPKLTYEDNSRLTILFMFCFWVLLVSP